jgi:secernin
MGRDAVVALGQAGVDGQAIFGQNSDRPRGFGQGLHRTHRHDYAAGEKVQLKYVDLPQARRVYEVLGSQPAGLWGYDFGINENEVAAGWVTLPARFSCQRPGLQATELIRLVLERSRTARQGVDLLTDMVERFGQGGWETGSEKSEWDNAFLIADPTEAYAVETAGNHWAYQEIREIRVLSGVRVIRQDWDRVSRQLAAYAIGNRLWPGDGSKLDFAEVVGQDGLTRSGSLRRWARATQRMQQQNGHLDTAFIRRLLGDHPQGADAKDRADHSASLCEHGRTSGDEVTTASIVAPLSSSPARLPMAWCCFGRPCTSIYFPVFLDGELPEAFQHGSQRSGRASFACDIATVSDQLSGEPRSRIAVRERFTSLQARLDEEAEEFTKEGAALRQRGATTLLQRQASLFMEHCVECFENVVSKSLSPRTLVAAGS